MSGPREFLQGECLALQGRKLSQVTTEKWKYQCGVDERGKAVQIANYYSEDHTLVAQKIRYADKTFAVIGNGKDLPMYGQWLWRDGGKKVVITEGEIDALSVSQVQQNKWPVVSLPNGAQSAAKAIKANLEWLEKFEEVVLMFDMDEPGHKAVEEVAGLLTPGKCKVARLPLKDASEMLKADRVTELVDAIWSAKVFRPDGIIHGDDITVDYLREQVAKGYQTQYSGLNQVLGGLRKGELTLFTAGTGVGKSTIVREIGHHFNTNLGLSIGNVFLEESYRKTAQAYIAIDNDVPLGALRADPNILSTEQWEASRKRALSNGRTYFYNHFGSLESDHLLGKLQYFAVGLNVDFILLDHISIVVSGQESSKEGERKDIDRLMTKLRSLIEQTGVGVIAIAHLAKAEGKSHEEGGRVALNDLRGSGTLKQIPDSIIALERDQQGDKANEAVVRVLKNREFGEVGPSCTVSYNPKTGRLLEVDSDPFAAPAASEFQGAF